MSASNGYPDRGIPTWLVNKTSGIWYEKNSQNIFVVNFSDPIYLNATERLLRTLGQRYGNETAIDAIDIGLMGLWGEWHVSEVPGATMPSQEIQKKVIDWHNQYFSQKKMMLMPQDDTIFAYALSLGTGWRADCLGSYLPNSWGEGNPWNHHTNMYTPRVARTPGAPTAWEHNQVQFEVCWDLCHWRDYGFDLDYIINYSLQYHMSGLNIKEPGAGCTLSSEWQEKFDYWQKHMGYRIYPSEISYAINNNTLSIISTWKNTGDAPPYNNLDIIYRLKSSTTSQEYKSDQELQGLLPGEIEHTDNFDITNITNGSYILELSVIEHDTLKDIELAIEQPDDGWYDIATLSRTFQVPTENITTNTTSNTTSNTSSNANTSGGGGGSTSTNNSTNTTSNTTTSNTNEQEDTNEVIDNSIVIIIGIIVILFAIASKRKSK